MKSNRFTVLAVASIAGLFSVSAQAAQLIVNGDFGQFGGAPANDPTVATGHYVTQAGPTLSQSTDNSPFTNMYSNNSSSWKRVDDTVRGDDGTRQDFTTFPYMAMDVNFDFRIDSLTNNPWGVQFDGNGSGGSSAVAFRIDSNESGVHSNQFAINQNGTPAGFLDILTLQAGKWYNVQAALDSTANTIIGSITPDGGSPVAFSASMVPGHTSLSSVLVRDRTAGVSGDLTLDNFSVVVPEPASLGVIGLAGLAMIRRRK